MFSLDGTTFQYTQLSFEQTLRTAPFGTYQSQNFKVRLENTDASKYELSNDKSGPITIINPTTNPATAYYAVTDVSAIDTIMPNATPSIAGNKTAIALHGRLGGDVQIVLNDQSLSENNLKAKGVTLQYQVNSIG